jgi:hypothetical protein
VTRSRRRSWPHDTVPVPYPLALAITLAVEVPVYLVVFRFAGLLAGWRGVGAAVGLNLCTHPLVWLVLSAHPGLWWFTVVEAAVCLVETLLLCALVRRDGALLSLTVLVANTASILAGLAVDSMR